jgi:O-antigen biosynthesis protein
LFSGWRPDAVLHEPRFSYVRAFEKLSIVILCHNHLDVTQRCLQSIRDNTLRVPYEVVVLDNASTDGTWEWLQAQADVRAIRSEENLGVGGGRNYAAEHATGDLLLFLDNDMVLFPGWELPAMLPFSRADTDIAGPVAWEVDPEPPPGYDFRPLQGGELYPFADAISGNCLFVRRECWEFLGGFDPTLHRFHEDGEWVTRARAAGARVVGTPGDWCEHHAHTSTGAIVEQLHARKWNDYAALCGAVADKLAPGALRRWLS